MYGVAHAAPGLVAAIQFQIKRSLLLLLTSEPDCAIAIESPWDNSVRDAAGNVILAEEDKNSINQTSQLADRHESWWKSLRNFTAAFVDGRLNEESCKLVICTNAHIGGGIAHSFVNRTFTEDDKWVEKQRKALAKAGLKPAEQMATHVQFTEEHPEDFLKVIRNLQVIDASGKAEEPTTMQEIFRLLRCTPEDQQFVLEALIGWINECVERHILSGDCAIIPVSAFNTRYRDEIGRGRQQRLLRRLQIDFASTLTKEQRKKHEWDTFQHQLHWVGFNRSPDILEQAVDDFLRYDVATTAYADIGDIPIQRFKARETDLRDQWRVIFNKESFDLTEANPELKCEAGRKIFNACASLNLAIEGMAPPDSYMTRGAFHHLANTPPNEPEVGWHPEFREMAKAVTPPNDEPG